LQALHRVRERLVGQRTGIINQIRAFLLERGVAVRQGLRFLRIELPGILAKRTDVLSPRMLQRPRRRVAEPAARPAARIAVPGINRLMNVLSAPVAQLDRPLPSEGSRYLRRIKPGTSSRFSTPFLSRTNGKCSFASCSSERTSE
jgi:hypothetical protein